LDNHPFGVCHDLAPFSAIIRLDLQPHTRQSDRPT
jgi:hypothetical protein